MDNDTGPASVKYRRESSVPEALKDDFCDPENPRAIKFEDISAAAYIIRDAIQKTPCIVGY